MGAPLVYKGEKNSIAGVAYLFQNGKLVSAGMGVSYAYTEEVTKFLLERYQALGTKDDIYFFINNEAARATLAISLSVEDGYILVACMPADKLPLKSVDAARSHEAAFRAIFGQK